MDIVIHFLKFRENPKEKGKLDVVYGQYFPQLQDYDTQMMLEEKFILLN